MQQQQQKYEIVHWSTFTFFFSSIIYQFIHELKFMYKCTWLVRRISLTSFILFFLIYLKINSPFFFEISPLKEWKEKFKYYLWQIKSCNSNLISKTNNFCFLVVWHLECSLYISIYISFNTLFNITIRYLLKYIY